MKEILRNHAIQISILFVIFILFFSNALGLIDFNFKSGSGITIRHILSEGGFSRLLDIISAAVNSLEVICLFVIGLLLCILLPVLSPVKTSLLTVISVVPPMYINYLRTGESVFLPMEYSLLTILMLYAVNVLISYFIETQAKQKIVNIFGQFVPPELVSELSKHPDQISLEGEAKNLTVFFCDLQNFSGVAEQLNPKQLAHLLNEYFTAMTTVLFKHGATIDKYIGDSIMAFWGAPVPQTDHARRSILASFEMHDEIRRLSVEFIKKGWPGPKLGIGINTGIMNVGNMGSKYRIAYTVVGDAVNLASRLESLTRIYKVPTIVSESTRNDTAGIIYRALDQVQVKGKHNKTKIYQPVCQEINADDKLKEKLDYHDKAINLYFEGQLEKAKVIFETLRENYKDEYYACILSQINKNMEGN